MPFASCQGGIGGILSNAGFPVRFSGNNFNSQRSHGEKQRIPNFPIENVNPGFLQYFLPGKRSVPKSWIFFPGKSTTSGISEAPQSLPHPSIKKKEKTYSGKSKWYIVHGMKSNNVFTSCTQARFCCNSNWLRLPLFRCLMQ